MHRIAIHSTSAQEMNGQFSSSADTPKKEPHKLAVQISADNRHLAGDLSIPPRAVGIVLFAHGSGSSRHSQRNRFVARQLQACGLATLLFDLLTPIEEQADANDGHLRFDIELLARRLEQVTHWIKQRAEIRDLGIGYFGASTGGAAALMAAAKLGSIVQAIVSRGGRPDLAGNALARVISPTLLIVGARDDLVLSLNRSAYSQLSCEKRFVVVPGATHLFEEAGALEVVASVAGEWFRRYLKSRENSISQSS